jgi:hypothetical protein
MDSHPAGGAQVALLGKSLRVTMQEPAKFLAFGSSDIHMTRTLTDGSFHLSPEPDAELLAIAHESGWAIVPVPGFGEEQIFLKPWARVEGVLRIGSGVGANQKVALQAGGERADTISVHYSMTTDESVRFHFDKVPEGQVHVFRYFEANPGGAGYSAGSQTQVVEARAGQTTQVVLGGEGVKVTGRLNAQPARGDILWRVKPQNLRPAAMKPKPGTPSPGYGFFCNEDGSFVVEDVPAGNYVLELDVEALNDRAQEGAFNTFPIGNRKIDIVIPDSAAGEFSVGEIVVPVEAK